MRENPYQSETSSGETKNEIVPRFIKEYSRENSQEERVSVAAAIREQRRRRDAWRIEQNARTEDKRNKEEEFVILRDQMEAYSSEGFLGKIKDYFAYRNAKAQIEENFGRLASAQSAIEQGESEKPEFQEVRVLLRDFYDGEKKRWIEAGYTPEDIERQFSEKHLSELSVDDYATLMRRFPGEMLTHVTRQGIRDHVSSFWHTAGAGDFSDGFKRMLVDGKLRSSLGIALQEHTKEEVMVKFLHLDTLQSREEALVMYESKFEQSLASGDAFADSAAVHVASENVMDAMYGSERGNEVFIAYPSAYVASQLRYGGKGTLVDEGASQHNDKWIYTKDHEGVSLDVGLVFIPEDARVDPRTGSRYRTDEQGKVIVPRRRVNEVLAARFEKKGFVQTFVQQLPYRMSRVPKEAQVALAEAAFVEFGIIDPEARKALLDPHLVGKLADLWGKENESQEYEKVLADYFYQNAENPYELAEDTVSSQEYWDTYFQENPGQRPSKVVYYKGGDPSRALNEWREKNGIVKRTEDPTYGFSEHNIADNSAEANEGKDRLASFARKVIDDCFPEKT
jgi:hypothetical protein